MLHRLPIVGLDVVNSQLVQSTFFMRWFFALTFRESIKPSSSLLFHIPQSIQSCLWNSARIQIWEDSTTCFVTMLQDASKMLSRWVEILWQKASGGFPLCLRHARLRSSRDPWEGGARLKENHPLDAFCKLFFFGMFWLYLPVAVFF